MLPNFQPAASNWDEHTYPSCGFSLHPRYYIHAEKLTHYRVATSQLPQNVFIFPRIVYQLNSLSRWGMIEKCRALCPALVVW